MNPLVELHGVSKRYGSAIALHATALDFERGKTTVLIGPSGCGKSTLLRLIIRLLDPDAGAIRFDGVPITAANISELRRRIGYVIQDGGLFPHLTALQNVVLGDRYAHGASREEARERAGRLFARFGLEGREDERPDDLSGGQQQRVAIARAFAGRPRALLLDEVTSALDPELVGEVLQAVRDLKEEGVTMLIATHEMSFAREVADLVAFLHEGRILELGPPDQVLVDPERPETKRFLRRLLEAGRV